MRVAPRTTEEALAAIQYGRLLYEAGQSRTHCHNQLEMSGWDEADADCAAALEPLQDYIDHPYRASIDYEAELADLRDAMDEEEWIRRGCP